MPGDLPDITAEWLLARCERDEESGCLIWTGECANEGRDPRARINGVRFYVRRAVWKAWNDKDPDWRTVSVSCKTPGCCEPTHLIARALWVAQTGRVMPLQQRARIAAAKRAKSELPQESVRRIRASSLSAREEAERNGIDKSMVILIRAGKVRRDYGDALCQLGA